MARDSSKCSEKNQTSFDFERSPASSTAHLDERPAEASVKIPLLFRASEDLDEAARTALERRLTVLIGEPVVLAVTDNRHTMISSRRTRKVLRVRLHHMFLDADDLCVRSLARYLVRSDRRAETRLDEFIEAHRHKIRPGRRRLPPLRTQGVHHDLAEIFDELNHRWYQGALRVRVTWGRRSPGRRRRRSIRLGTFVAEDQLIRIHPVLDRPWVPRFFVAYVLFHEMLHVVIPAPIEGGRHRFHCREFRARERSYPDYQRSIAWEKANLRRLLAG